MYYLVLQDSGLNCLRFAFSIFDLDNNNYISRGEMLRIVGMACENGNSISGDTDVEMQQVLKMIKQEFRMYDTNG